MEDKVREFRVRWKEICWMETEVDAESYDDACEKVGDNLGDESHKCLNYETHFLREKGKV